MTSVNFMRLLLLAALWGGSFLLMRVTAGTLGPTMLIGGRVGFAALFLLAIGFYLKRQLVFRRHWQHFFIIGFFNSALPFLLFAYAAQTLTAATMSVVNATAPIWGAIIGAIWTKTALNRQTVIGLGLGIAGVSILVGLQANFDLSVAIIPISAATLAAVSYGIATNYAKSAPAVSSFDNAHGSMWAATLIIVPLLPFFPATEPVSSSIVLAVIALGVLCTGVAYLLYFKLIADVGAAPALSVTFLVPVFGILWGYLFLDESVGWHTVAGSALVIWGTMLVTGFSVQTFFKERKASYE
ncbi:MAG: DMT family transporter [Gammaproteobacteria bacterium]|nr:DMT family transporter [Gammaproteobacteria bacterium]